MPQLSYHALLKLLLPEDWRQTESSLMGLERELLRIAPTGDLAEGKHPQAWGSALTHPDITLDFAETQPELVAPPFPDPSSLASYVYDLHAYLAQKLPAEDALWYPSMPPRLSNERIQPAEFGSSNSGRLKSIYRRGLANRYGKKMQVISGVHFNFSWTESFWKRLHERVGDSRKLSNFISENYLGLLRNYLRKSWLLAYLMGTTPAIDRSFVKREPAELQAWKAQTLYGPYATSLRMSQIGYVNSSRCSASVSFNSLTDYLSTLYQAITSECPGFSLIGLQDEDGSYRQLNNHLLQIENEHYALIRPKQVPQPGERPFQALRSRGVSYVEIRAIDNQPDVALGMHEYQMDFLRLFLLSCLLQPNPPLDRSDTLENRSNHQQAALLGRQPGVKLRREGEEILLQDWGLEIMAQMRPLAETLDTHLMTERYLPVLERMEQMLRQPELTPSARVWADIEAGDLEFLDWGLQRSAEITAELKQHRLNPEREALFDQHVAESLRAQAELDAQPQEDFEHYLKQFFRLKQSPELTA